MLNVMSQGMPSDSSHKLEKMSWNKRITIARTRLGINKAEFSRRVGVSTATTTDWENGQIKMIDGRNLVKVASILNVTPEWIMTGFGIADTKDDDFNAAVAEFAWVYAHATEPGRAVLSTALLTTRQNFMRRSGERDSGRDETKR